MVESDHNATVFTFYAGHLVQDVPEFPLVVTDKIQEYTRTKQAVSFLHRIRVWKDINKVCKCELDSERGCAEI
jgi:hypothetical protein